MRADRAAKSPTGAMGTAQDVANAALYLACDEGDDEEHTMATFATHDGVTLAYEDRGGNGFPLVMLHGWGQTQAMFRHHLADLAPDRRVITLDLRGHGRSDNPISVIVLPASEVLSLVMAELNTVPPYVGVPLLFDHCAQDWRDVLPRIDVPTLVIGCDGSHVDPSLQRYIAEQIPNAGLHVFPTVVASSHFPFLENPTAFNAVVEQFLEQG